MYDKSLLQTPKDVAGRGGVLDYLGLSRWYVRQTDQPVAAQVLLLGAFSGARKVSLVGSASLSGVETSEYEVAMPAESLSGTKLEPFTVDAKPSQPCCKHSSNDARVFSGVCREARAPRCPSRRGLIRAICHQFTRELAIVRTAQPHFVRAAM